MKKKKKMLGYIKKEKENDENKRKKMRNSRKVKVQADEEEIKQEMRKGNEREKKIIVGEPNNLFLCLYC